MCFVRHIFLTFPQNNFFWNQGFFQALKTAIKIGGIQRLVKPIYIFIAGGRFCSHFLYYNVYK